MTADNATRETLKFPFARTLQHHVQTGCCSVVFPRPLRSNNTIKAPFEEFVKPPWGPSATWSPLAPVIPEGLTHLLINQQDIQHFAIERDLCSLAPLLGPHLIDMDETFQPFDGEFHLPDIMPPKVEAFTR